MDTNSSCNEPDEEVMLKILSELAFVAIGLWLVGILVWMTESRKKNNNDSKDSD